MDNYEKRVRAYESKGCSRSDAQAVVDAEDLNKVRHTPGPWIWKSTDDPMDLAILIGKDGSEIMNFGNGEQYYPSQGTEPNEANARLIATAPELLEACKAMLSWHEAHYTELMPIDTHFNKNSMLNKARRFIEKAEGK